MVLRGQQSTPVIGLLCGGTPESDVVRVDGFRRGLNEAGFVDGKNVLLEYRWAEEHYERMSALAADLVDRKVSLLVAMGGIPSAVAAKKATGSIPILIAIGGDPVQLGLVPSLSHPGANLTGVSFLINSMGVKQLELLHDMLTPGVVVGFLGNSKNPNAETDKKNAQSAAEALGQKLVVVQASTDAMLDDAFGTLAREGVGALVVGADFFLVSRRDKLIGLAARQRLPAVYPLRDFVTGGGLMSYGTDLAEGYRSLGLYAGRILRGEKPADLPVQQSTKIELVINLKTAKALGLTVPPSLLARADEVIE
ncbi:MAG: ABC transporter substrate-binding protein [Xanthobacteraceae bacterium]|nr:ABC transporter substrate-binding protein [Xanthobacteraceae bacterium]